jgi:RNA polymerase sigma factor (sigma-70 family)
LDHSSESQTRSHESGDESEEMHALFAQLYPDIKRLARARLANVGGHTRLQFFAYVGKILRSVMIDYIRNRDASKRGGGVTLMTLSHVGEAPAPWLDNIDLIDLDRALTELKSFDVRLYQIVEMHVFSGLTPEEIGTELAVTSRTINREIAKAKTLLSQALGTAPT